MESLLEHDVGADLASEPVSLALALSTDDLEAEGPPPPTLPPRPERIGRFEIRDTIAQGGQGVVYLAVQDRPRRRVALKVIRPGVLTEDTLRRFRFEAEILGRLKHPGIAQIHDAGEAETAVGPVPFLAMEYIEGQDLREYAVRKSLSAADRLELLARVCDAVHHAHQQGIVHRDLKPANILVVETEDEETGGDAIGQPKVLDFGVSRTVRDGVRDLSRITQTGMVVGTVAYMSPEQARGDPTVDTRSDVYALGAVGFELLCGHLPHGDDATPLQALRTIQERPAPRLDSIDRRYRGDVSIVLGKAMAFEREHRYDSAAALSADLRRYLAEQPIAARPPTLTYQLVRFIRRNRLVVAAAALAVVALVAGLVLALVAQRNEARQRVLADRRADEAHRAAYAAQIQAAAICASAGDVHSARRRLEDAPEDLRGWEWSYLSASVEDEIGHVPMALSMRAWVSVSGDGKLALLVPDESRIRVLDLETGEHRDVATAGVRPHLAAIRPDRRSAVVRDLDGTLQLLDLAGEAPPRRLLADEGTTCSLSTSLEAGLATVITAVGEPWKYSALVLDLRNLDVTARFENLSEARSARVGPGGELLAIGTQGAVLVFDVATGHLRFTFRDHAFWAHPLVFSPCGTKLAFGGVDARIHVWSLTTGERLATLGRVQFAASALAFHPDGRWLVSGHLDGSIRHWSLETGRCEWVTFGRKVRDPETDGIQAIVFPEGDETLFGLSRKGIHRRTTPATLPEVLHHPAKQYPFAYDAVFDPSGRHLVTAGWDGSARVWDVATRRLVTALDCPVNTLWARYSPDGARLLTCSQDGYTTHHLRLWDARTYRLLDETVYPQITPCVALRPGWEDLVIARGSEVRALDPETFEARTRWRADAVVWSLDADPAGSRVACGTEKGRCSVLDAATLEPLLHLDAHVGGLEALAFSPDGSRLATGGGDDRVRVWDVRSGRELLSFHTPESREFLCLRWSPDGRRILAGTRDPAIRVWDAETGRDLARLTGHGSYVRSLAFSPDGRILASASGDNTIRIWDSRPLAERIRARDRQNAAEKAAEEPVKRLLEDLETREKVLEAIDGDPSLSEEEKHAARNVALRTTR